MIYVKSILSLEYVDPERTDLKDELADVMFDESEVVVRIRADKLVTLRDRLKREVEKLESFNVIKDRMEEIEEINLILGSHELIARNEIETQKSKLREKDDGGIPF